VLENVVLMTQGGHAQPQPLLLFELLRKLLLCLKKVT
jgi:hypothetical protein